MRLHSSRDAGDMFESITIRRQKQEVFERMFEKVFGLDTRAARELVECSPRTNPQLLQLRHDRSDRLKVLVEVCNCGAMAECNSCDQDVEGASPAYLSVVPKCALDPHGERMTFGVGDK